MRTYSPKKSWLLLSLASLLFSASLFTTLFERPSSDATLQRNPLNVSVEIVGEVRNPGIYSFPGEVIVKRALLEAGGTEGGIIANPQVLTNTLNAGSKIVVMRVQEHILIVKVARMEPNTCIVFSVPLDLNEIEEEHLTLIPGIGPRLAQRIIRYRSEKGGFREIDDLKGVRGIGEEKLRSLERYLTVRK
jgi:competence protein ComEA